MLLAIVAAMGWGEEEQEEQEEGSGKGGSVEPGASEEAWMSAREYFGRQLETHTIHGARHSIHNTQRI